MENQERNNRALFNSIIFLAGFFSCIFALSLFSFFSSGIEKPLGIGFSDNAKISPGDWIKLSQISITGNTIILEIPNASISSYAPTGSMRPVFDYGANGIRIVPGSAEQIKVGDIVTFGNENIVHRVIEKGEDSGGDWFITKGDNNQANDGKIRFSDIKYVTIGILY